MQCSNHLKQAGLALHNHHDTHNNFPAARSYRGSLTSGSPSYWGDQLELCAFNENQALYSVIQQGRRDAEPNDITYDNAAIVSATNGARIPILVCPTDPLGNTMSDNGTVRYGLSNIVSCRGDVHHRQEWNSGYLNNANYKKGIQRGGFAPLVWKDFAAISDGTSNTIAYSEAAISEGHYNVADTRVRGGIAIGGLNETDPSRCLQKRNTGNPGQLVTNGTVNAVNGTGGGRGSRMLYGFYYNTGFVTVLPPNSPSCGPGAINSNGWALYSASSYHPGGVNVALFDGAVRFVSEAVDAGNSSSKQELSSQSPYGVWGEYGSIAGGEPTGLL